MLLLVNTHKKLKKKYWICNESYKFANSLDLIPKERYIKDKARKDRKIMREK